MSFRILGLPAERFSPLFALTESELAARGGVRKIADGPSPCRVSLADAEAGEAVLLINYEHHPLASPYRMRYAIFVREGDQTYDRLDDVPDQLRKRMLAARSFDDAGMMLAHELVDGRALEAAIERQLANARARYLHLHFASAGCYAARVERA
jgi:hypothetical protein